MEIPRKFLTAGHLVHLRPCSAAGHLDTYPDKGHFLFKKVVLDLRCRTVLYLRVSRKSVSYFKDIDFKDGGLLK